VTRAIITLGVIGLLICTSPVQAQNAPSASPAASPAPAPSPSPAADPATGPAFGPNDPCTSIGAIVSRPSQTTSVCTVRPNHVLIETGYQNTSADGTSTTAQYPQALVRIGTAVPALEIDLGVPEYERVSAAGGTASGATDVGAGVKYVIGYSPKFNYGANVFFTAPTGTDGFSAGTSTSLYNLNLGYTINSVLSLAGTLGLSETASDGDHYASFIPSLVLTAGLPNSTGLFVEGAQFTHAVGEGTPTRTQLLGGITRGLSAKLQIDVEAGRSATESTGKYRFVGFGASYYF
jgi:hypothetical protein